MSRVLRNFRVKLLQEKNTGGYFLYALGEVVLIVIGILVALWIDNWNEERLEAQREQFYLRGLQEEFQASLGKLDTLISVNQQSYSMGREFLNRIPAVETRAQEAELSRVLLASLYNEISYNPNNSVLTEMLSSGRLQTLTDPDLRQHLTVWGSILESLKRQENSLGDIRKRVIDVMSGPDGSILSLLADAGMEEELVHADHRHRDHSNLHVLQSLEFENKMLIFLLSAESTDSNFYQPLRRQILVILDDIESGLKP